VKTPDTLRFISILSLILLAGVTVWAQQPAQVTANGGAVPPLVKFSGTLADLNGKPLSGVVGVTFALYKDQQGGAPVWLETQNVQLDKSGRYSVMLGSMSSTGMPADVFVAGEARWVGIQPQGQAEQTRVLLVSVPYAMKAGDAQTLGGLPPSAFVLAAPPAGGAASAGNSNAATPLSTTGSTPPPASLEVTTTGGTANTIPMFTSSTNIANSILTQTGTSAINVVGKLILPSNGSATASKGTDSQPEVFVGSSFNSTSSAAVNQKFQWQVEPANNNTSAPSGTLNLLFVSGTGAPAETGLHVASTGQITFATGQTFPGVPELGGTNTFSGNQTVTGNVTASGEVQGGVVNATTSFDLGGVSFASGSASNLDAFLGFAGNATITGGSNTAVGYHALLADTTGGVNVALGMNALSANATGAYNVAAGANALGASTSGFANTGVGNGAGKTIDGSALTGKNNTALGTGSGFSNGALTNASAIGANAVAGASNTLVLGSVNGVNGQTVTVNVGIGTTSPMSTLQVVSGVNADSASDFTGATATAGSGDYGSDGVDSTAGNGDLKSSGTRGGDGVTGVGGKGVFNIIGVGGDGIGGSFVGGNNGSNGGGGDGVDGYAGSGYAGNFTGDVLVSGNLSAGSKDFKIDHPLDPAGKYLVHASIESSEMMNLYTGNVITDAQGEATVQLPDWFEVLNTDFRYQLTVIGQFAQAIVSREIQNHEFTIRTSAPNVKVSWQVTGVRQDAYAKSHPLVVEEEKEPRVRGFYIHPELYGAPANRQIEWARHPVTMKRMQERQAAQTPVSAAPGPQLKSSIK
jgi:trimeric autotransporter adhesin